MSANCEQRVATAPPSRSETDVRHDFVAFLSLCMSGKNQSLWCVAEKGYAETGTFYVMSITLIGVRFSLLEAIGSLGLKEVTPITFSGETSSQLNQIERCGVTLNHELFLDDPYKALEDTGNDATAKNGSFGVNTAVTNQSTPDNIAQIRSHTALGARLPRLSGGMGRNIVGVKKTPSELARTGGVSLCHLSKGML